MANFNSLKISPGVFTFTLTSPVGNFSLNQEIPGQNVQLISYRLELTPGTLVNTAPWRIVYFDSDLFPLSTISTDRSNFTGIPLYTNNSVLTLDYPYLSLTMAKDAYRNINYVLRGSDNSILTNFVSLTLTFGVSFIKT